MDRVTRAKLDSLLHMLRTRPDQLGSVEALARRLQLDPMIVRRVAEEQGVAVEAPDEGSNRGGAAQADPNQSTQVMSVDALLEKL